MNLYSYQGPRHKTRSKGCRNSGHGRRTRRTASKARWTASKIRRISTKIDQQLILWTARMAVISQLNLTKFNTTSTTQHIYAYTFRIKEWTKYITTATKNNLLIYCYITWNEKNKMLVNWMKWYGTKLFGMKLNELYCMVWL